MKIEHLPKQCDCEKDFYKYFQLGMEIEGEYIGSVFSSDINYGDDHDEETWSDFWNIKPDGSINRTSNDGYCGELVNSNLIDSEAQEKKAVQELKRGLEFTEAASGKRIFAYQNSSAGTHVHFSFKPSAFTDLNATQLDKRLSIFDCVDFERYFFKEYLRKFNTSKFTARLSSNSNYCKSGGEAVRSRMKEGQYEGYLQDLQGSEDFKKGRERYTWLNVESVRQEKGLELRIYPYLQTIEGVQEVINFTKQVVTHFWKMQQTQKAMLLMDLYHQEIDGNQLRFDRLTDLEKIIAHSLELTGNPSRSGDTKLILARWYKKRPSLVASIS